MGVVAGRPRRPGDPTSAYFLQFPMVSPLSCSLVSLQDEELLLCFFDDKEEEEEEGRK